MSNSSSEHFAPDDAESEEEYTLDDNDPFIDNLPEHEVV
jgi:hypothetical protein